MNYNYRQDIEIARDLNKNGPTKLKSKKFKPPNELEACMVIIKK